MQGAHQDPSEARFLRKHYKQGGYDEEEEQEDKRFKEDFEGALKSYSKKGVSADVEKQVEYFGFRMEPFNMKEEQEMGDIDQEGFFIFHGKRRSRDPWLDSLDQDGDEALDKLRKKIKLQQREKTVYQADQRIQEEDHSEPEGEQNGQKGVQEAEDESSEKKDGLKPSEIKLLLCELLPFGSNANKYLKTLKKEKEEELYDKVMFLCNEYIAATGEHDILTLKKQDLEEEVPSEPQQKERPLEDWNKSEDEKQEDDIF